MIAEDDEPPVQQEKPDVFPAPSTRPGGLVAAERETSAADAMLRLSEGREASPERAARRQREFIPDFRKDDYYWVKRRKNNDAAKRSREKRRSHDVAMGQKIVELTSENEKLHRQLHAVRCNISTEDEYVSPPPPAAAGDSRAMADLNTPVFPMAEPVAITPPVSQPAPPTASDSSETESDYVPVAPVLSRPCTVSATSSTEPYQVTATSSSDDSVKSDWTTQQRRIPLKLRHKLLSNNGLPYNHVADPPTNSNSGPADCSGEAIAEPRPDAAVDYACSDADSTCVVSGSGLDPCSVDIRYVERRQRNNMAARKCRENRKSQNELRLAKANILETENGKLKRELRRLAAEFGVLKALLEEKQRAEAAGECFSLPPLDQAIREACPPSPPVERTDENDT